MYNMIEKYDNLLVGKRYKNYREVCDELQVEVKTGGAKTKQVAQWGLNFTWRRERYEWIVLSVHEDPEAMSKGMATAAMLRLGILAYLKREIEVGERVRIRNRNYNPNPNPKQDYLRRVLLLPTFAICTV